MIPLLLALAASAQSLDYAFPTTSAHYGHWYPTAYFDHGGNTDWDCGSITYSGHRGSDFGAGSFTGMDAGRDVTAAAPGIVTAVHDGEPDRCTTGTCGGAAGYGNYVRVAHTDGKQTVYGHLKRFSLTVAPGDFVECGQVIGQMGSSGNSTGPHLHFTVHHPDGPAMDPFYGSCGDAGDWWVDQGVHDGLPSLTCGTYPTCDLVQTLTCGDVIASANDDTGSTNRHHIYGCSEYSYTGPEIAFSVSTPLDEPIQLTLSGLADDLDLYVADGPACDGGGCLAASHQPDLSDESVTIDADAGQAYTVVVDGWEGAVSDFTLTVDCQGLPDPEDTGDPVDTDPPEDTDTDPPDTDLPDDTDPIDTSAPDTHDPSSTPRVEPGARDRGCGCAAPGPLGSLGGLPILLAFALSRRRRGHTPRHARR